MDSDSSGILYVTLVCLLMVSAFFSACETAYSSLNKIRLRGLAEDKNKQAQRALDVSKRFDSLISTILVGNNVVNMASASIATVLLTDLLGASGAAIATVVMTVLVLIFGEILPKSMAKENSEQVAMRFAAPLGVMIVVMRPVVWVFVKINELAMRIIKSDNDHPSVTEEELKYIVESIEQEGVLEEQESELVQSALEFDEITVHEILTPRVDVLALPMDCSIEDAKEQVMQSHYSRIPVYKGTIDNIVGVLQVRDFLKAVVSGLAAEQENISTLLTDCVYVHKTMDISSLLAQLKASKLHLAVVSDDYGGTMGIVTMEDVLEQLVGDIWDESDEVEEEFVQTGEDIYNVSGDMNVLRLLDELEIEHRAFESDFNTVGGWATEMLGHLPDAGESFSFGEWKITVETVEDKRIISLVIEKRKEDAEES